MKVLGFRSPYSFACALATQWRSAPVTPAPDKKEAPIIFTSRRGHMGEWNKLGSAVVSVGVLLGCAAPLQETEQIRCTEGAGRSSIPVRTTRKA